MYVSITNINVCICIYICMYIYIYVQMYREGDNIHMYVYVHRSRLPHYIPRPERAPASRAMRARVGLGKACLDLKGKASKIPKPCQTGVSQNVVFWIWALSSGGRIPLGNLLLTTTLQETERKRQFCRDGSCSSRQLQSAC